MITVASAWKRHFSLLEWPGILLSPFQFLWSSPRCQFSPMFPQEILFVFSPRSYATDLKNNPWQEKEDSQAWALLLLLLATTFTERNRKIMARLTWKYQIDQCWDEVAVSWMKPVQRHRAGSAAKAGAKITGTFWRDVPTLSSAMQREKNPLNQSTIWKDWHWPCLLKQVTVPTQEIVIQIQFILKCSDLQNHWWLTPYYQSTLLHQLLRRGELQQSTSLLLCL